MTHYLVFPRDLVTAQFAVEVPDLEAVFTHGNRFGDDLDVIIIEDDEMSHPSPRAETRLFVYNQQVAFPGAIIIRGSTSSRRLRKMLDEIALTGGLQSSISIEPWHERCRK